jgi:hypothetical protein
MKTMYAFLKGGYQGKYLVLSVLIINLEIDKVIEGADIVRFITAQRIKWLGHIQRIDQARPTRKLLDWRPMGTRPVGRSRQRWKEDVMKDLKN